MAMPQATEAPAMVSLWYDAINPVVSIVVLNWNKAQLTIECLRSIFEHTQGERYEIIVVDNGSRTDEWAALAAFEGKHRLLRLKQNRFFGEGNNLGAELARGEFVMFMNNDVTVTPDWLFPLVNIFRTHSDCGIAGPKFVYPHGMLQEAGALLDEYGDAVQIGKFQDPLSPRFNRTRVVDYVSAACLLMRKDHFDRVLGFDFTYEPAYYEDVDLCMKIGELGMKTYYVSHSCIVHHENATTADPENGLNLRGLVDINRGKFFNRWHGFLKTARHEPSRFGVTKPLPLENERPKAAVFTTDRIDAGEQTQVTFAILRALHALGFEPSLLTLDRISKVRVRQISDLTGANLPDIKMDTTNERDKGSLFDVFIAMGGKAAVCTAPLGHVNYLWDALEDQNVAGYRSIVLNPMDVDIAGFLGFTPKITSVQRAEKKNRKVILSEGRFVEGVGSNRQDMLIRAFRRLIESGLDAELHLVGSLMPEAIHREFFLSCERLAVGLPVRFFIDASSGELSRLYAEAFIYWQGTEASCDKKSAARLSLAALRGMSAGAIPIVAHSGTAALPETEWTRFRTEDDLVNRTGVLFAATDQKLDALRSEAQGMATNRSPDHFLKVFRSLLKWDQPPVP